jgi:hypothetical protein
MISQKSPVFSLLHQQALINKRMSVSLFNKVRRRLWHFLVNHDSSYGVQRDPNDNWIDNSSIREEVTREIPGLYGWSKIEYRSELGDCDLHSFFLDAYPSRVFDVIQLWYGMLNDDLKHEFQDGLNSILQTEGVPWIFNNSNFFQMDSQFMEEHVLQKLHELYDSKNFTGAQEEFVEARNDLSGNDTKDAILNACKSFESTMKCLLGKNYSGDVTKLAKKVRAEGFLDDLPPSLQEVFVSKVLQSLPVIRNDVAGHGQGIDSVTVDRDLAELSVNLAGAFNLFLMRRELKKRPVTIDDELLDEEPPF